VVKLRPLGEHMAASEVTPTPLKWILKPPYDSPKVIKVMPHLQSGKQPLVWFSDERLDMEVGHMWIELVPIHYGVKFLRE
jgi:hypothetical protein